jgi:hypothetical protein
MKLEIFEFQGKPIEAADRKKALVLITNAMDSIEAELGKCTADNAKEFQKRIATLVDDKIKEMPISKTVELDSLETLTSLVSTVGDSLTLCVEDGNLIGYIAVPED